MLLKTGFFRKPRFFVIVVLIMPDVSKKTKREDPLKRPNMIQKSFDLLGSYFEVCPVQRR